MSKEINQLFDYFITGFMNLAPKLILATAILLIGFIVAKVAQKLVKQFILYLHRNVNEKWTKQALRVDLQSSVFFISKAVFWFVIICTITIISQILGLARLISGEDGWGNFLPNMLGAVVIIFAGIIIGKIVSELIISATLSKGISSGENAGGLVRYLILIVAVIIALDQIGIDIVFLINLIDIILAAFLFGAALAFGLGAKTSISNILGSYYLQKNYGIGDTIQIEDIQGVIVKITTTAVIIDTKSGQVIIPAKDFNEQRTVLIKKK